jgi:hypothetical protein
MMSDIFNEPKFLSWTASSGRHSAVSVSGSISFARTLEALQGPNIYYPVCNIVRLKLALGNLDVANQGPKRAKNTFIIVIFDDDQ